MARGKQVQFPARQRHTRNFEWGMIAFCILCIIIAVVIAKATHWGIETRP